MGPSRFYDPQPLDDLRKTLAADAELRGGDVAAAAGPGEGPADEPPLEIEARGVEPGHAPRGFPGDARRQQRHRDSSSARTVDGQRRDHVLELAHVSRP